MPCYKIILVFIRGLIVSRAKLSLELVALRHQRPHIHNDDRLFWIVVSRIWKGWRQALTFVQPETGFQDVLALEVQS